MTTVIERTPTHSNTDCRISFRQPVNRTGSVDGAWWPRSKDLAAEAPALFDVFWTAGRDMSRVTYNLDSWESAPRKMHIAGKLVRVSGYHYGNPRLATVADSREADTADLLVIPCDTTPAVAERLLAIAAEPGNTLTAQEMIGRATS
jgi:hypothetical protein